MEVKPGFPLNPGPGQPHLEGRGGVGQHPRLAAARPGASTSWELVMSWELEQPRPGGGGGRG